jgi:hypothetical protein
MSEDEWSPIHESTVYSLGTAESCVTVSQLIRDGVAEIALDADVELIYEQARSLALRLLAAVEPQQAA